MNALKITLPEAFRANPPVVSLIPLTPVAEAFCLENGLAPVLVNGAALFPTDATAFSYAYSDFEPGEVILLVDERIVKISTSSGPVGICCSLISIIKETDTMLKATVISSIGSVPYFVGEELNIKKVIRYRREFYKFS